MGRQGCLVEKPLLEKSLRLSECLEGLPALLRQEPERSHALVARCVEGGGQRGRTKQPGQVSLTAPPLHSFSQRPQGLREGPVLLGEPGDPPRWVRAGLAW